MKLSPEYQWKVSINDDTLLSQNWNGELKELSLDDIQRVYVRTTDEGPFITDVWFGIETANDLIEVPQGCTGEELLIKFLETLPNFEMNGMNSTENEVHDRWKRK